MIGMADGTAVALGMEDSVVLLALDCYNKCSGQYFGGTGLCFAVPATWHEVQCWCWAVAIGTAEGTLVALGCGALLFQHRGVRCGANAGQLPWQFMWCGPSVENSVALALGCYNGHDGWYFGGTGGLCFTA